jgi:hypothetical protein
MNSGYGIGKLYGRLATANAFSSVSLLLERRRSTKCSATAHRSAAHPYAMSFYPDRMPIADQYLPSHRMRCAQKPTNTAPICYAIP